MSRITRIGRLDTDHTDFTDYADQTDHLGGQKVLHDRRPNHEEPAISSTLPSDFLDFRDGSIVAHAGGMEDKVAPSLHFGETTRLAIGAFFDVYNELAGFPEVVVRRGVAVALEDAGLTVRQEVPLPVWFRGRRLATFRADLIVDPGVIIEVKVAPELLAINKVQLMHYLRATDLEVGLLLNFGRRPEFARVIFHNARKPKRGEPTA